MESFLDLLFPDHILTYYDGGFFYGTNIKTNKNEQCGYFDGAVISNNREYIGYYNGDFDDGGIFQINNENIGYSDGAIWYNFDSNRTQVAYYSGDESGGTIDDYRKNRPKQKNEQISKANNPSDKQISDLHKKIIDQINKNIEKYKLFAPENEGITYKKAKMK